MARLAQNLWFSGSSFAALLLIAGCSGRSTYEPPMVAEPSPPPTHAAEPGTDGTGLLGGPVSKGTSEANGLISYRRADGVQVTAMRPIANPEDSAPRPRPTSPGHRAAHRIHHRIHRHIEHPRVQASIPAYHPTAQLPTRPAVVERTRPVPPQQHHASPVPPPHVAAVAPRSIQPVAKPTPTPMPHRAVQNKDWVKSSPNSTGWAPAPDAKVFDESETPPAVTDANSQSAAVTVPAPMPIPPDPKLAGLQAQLAPQLAKAAKLEIAPGLTSGQSVAAHLTLPKNLLASIQHEAPKHGLGAAATSVQVTATLMGDGYDVRPDGAQTRRLESGVAPDFTWQVKRRIGAAGPLRADVQADLGGARRPLSFALASVGPDTATGSTAQAPPARRSWLGPLDKNGQRTVLGAFLVLAAIFIAALIARNAGAQRRREERRKKFTALSEYNLATGSDNSTLYATEDEAREAQARLDDEERRHTED